MADQKPTMLIAEDSRIADQYQQLFKDEFEVSPAKNGSEAFALAKEHDAFDVCIVDIIMPVEDTSKQLRDAESTGLRLIEYLWNHKKSRRFLVITVRPDIRSHLDKLVGKDQHELLLKHETRAEEIRAAVHRLMAR